jgi:hypothetical protein
MKFMLLIYANEGAWSDEERARCYKDSTQLAHDLKAKGLLVGVNPLEPVATAKSVRVKNGKRVVTDGPFAETHEQLGGYFLIDVKSFDEAIAVAERIPGVSRGSVEIRPIMDLPDLPAG